VNDLDSNEQSMSSLTEDRFFETQYVK